MAKKEPNAMLKLNNVSYQIISEDETKAPTVTFTTYRVLVVVEKGINEGLLKQFVKKFRLNHCKGKANIDIVDDAKTYATLDKEPKTYEDHVFIGDHVVGFSSFEHPEVLYYYPLKDEWYRRCKEKVESNEEVKS